MMKIKLTALKMSVGAFARKDSRVPLEGRERVGSRKGGQGESRDEFELHIVFKLLYL